MSDHKGHDLTAVYAAIRAQIISRKANCCPMTLRLGWHAAGTFDHKDGSGGTQGATMRFAPEAEDPANAGLSVVRDLLEPVKKQFPEISHADLWVIASCAAVEFCGGPKIPFSLGRSDATSGAACPGLGRLPDGALDAAHLREVFGRMGFNDQEIVALSGGHTLGGCHYIRSGYDGSWTKDPLRFDNEYFRNLVNLEWVEVPAAEGKVQYEDKETHTLMMLPTDIALLKDPQMREHVERYAADNEVFRAEFAAAMGKLLALGTGLCPVAAPAAPGVRFRAGCQHGRLQISQRAKEEGADVHEVEPETLRTGLHKSAFWDHNHMLSFLLDECRLSVHVQDAAGDTPLHDAARFGHVVFATALLDRGANPMQANHKGLTPLDLAVAGGKDAVVAAMRATIKAKQVRILLVRHAESVQDANAAALSEEDSDALPLTQVGHEQARILGERLGPGPKTIHTAPSTRARQTAAAAFPGEFVEVVPALLSSAKTSAQMRKEMQQGVSATEQAVAQGLLDHIQTTLSSPSCPPTLVAFTHGFAIRGVVRHILGAVADMAMRVDTAPTGVTELAYDGRSWSMISFNDAGHLDGGDATRAAARRHQHHHQHQTSQLGALPARAKATSKL